MDKKTLSGDPQNYLQSCKMSFHESLNNLSKMVLSNLDTNNYILQCFQICEVVASGNENKSVENSIDKIIELAITAFSSPSTKLRCITIRLLRYCMLNKNIWIKFLKKRIDFYIVKNLDFSTTEKEIEQSIKFFIKATVLFPNILPESITSCIQAHCRDITKDEDKFDSVYVYMLCNIVMENPDFLRTPSAKNTFFNLLSKISHKKSLECLVDVVMYTAEYVSPKKLSYKKINYYRMLTPVTLTTNTDCKVNLATLSHVYAKMNAISEYPLNISLKLILDSWTGIFDFGMDPLGLNTTLSQLPYENINFQMQLVTLLYDLIEAPFPAYKNSLMDTLMSYVTNFESKSINNTSTLKDFNAADEALHEVLSINGPTNYLVDLGKVKRTYKILVLYHCDILKYLTLLIMDTSNMELKTIYVILLSEIIFQIDTFLPTLCSQGMGILDQLRHKVHPLQNDVMTKFDFVVRSVCQYISWKSQFSFVSNFSLLTHSYFYRLPKFDSVNPTHRKNKGSNYSTDRIDPSNASNVSRDSDAWLEEIVSVEHMCSNSPNNWNWETLLKFFYHPKMLSPGKEHTGLIKVLEQLLNFFSFTFKTHTYKCLDSAETKIISLTGITLIQYLSKMETNPNISKLITSYYQNLSDFIKLDQTDVYVETAGALSDLTSDCRLNIVILMLAIAIKDPTLVNYIHKANIFIKLELLCTIKESTDFFKNLVISMDYKLSAPSYLILKRCLSAHNNHSLRLFCTKFLRVILRTDVEAFENWGLNLLAGAIHDENSTIVKEAMSIMLEAFANKALVFKVFEMKILFTSIPEAEKLVPRFFCIPPIVTICIKNGYAKQLLNDWMKTYYFEYPNWVKDSLHEHTHNAEIKSFFPASLFPPYHFYGELCQTNEGFQFLYSYKLIEKIVFDFNKNYLMSMNNSFFNILPPLWAIGHIGATMLGIKYLLKIHPQIVNILTKLVHMSTKFYSVKGVAVFVLNMLQNTKPGQTELIKCGWTRNSSLNSAKQSSLSSEKGVSKLHRSVSNSMEDIRKKPFTPETLPKEDCASLSGTPKYAKKLKSSITEPMLQSTSQSTNESLIDIISSAKSQQHEPHPISRSTSSSKILNRKVEKKIRKKSSSITWKSVSTKVRSFMGKKKGAAGKLGNSVHGRYNHSRFFHHSYTQLETFLSISSDDLSTANNDSFDLAIASKCLFSYFNNSVILPDNYQLTKYFFKLNHKYSNKNKYNTAHEDIKSLESHENNIQSPFKKSTKNSSNTRVSPAAAPVNTQNSDYNCVGCGSNSKCFNLLLKHDSGGRVPAVSNEIFPSSRYLNSLHSSQNSIQDSNESSGMAISELLRLIYLVVTSKLTKELEKSLLIVKNLYPILFQSLCVYDKCMYIADRYNGSLESRRLIHQLFNNTENANVPIIVHQNESVDI